MWDSRRRARGHHFNCSNSGPASASKLEWVRTLAARFWSFCSFVSLWYLFHRNRSAYDQSIRSVLSTLFPPLCMRFVCKIEGKESIFYDKILYPQADLAHSGEIFWWRTHLYFCGHIWSFCPYLGESEWVSEWQNPPLTICHPLHMRAIGWHKNVPFLTNLFPGSAVKLYHCENALCSRLQNWNN